MKLKWPGFDAETVTAIEEHLEMDYLTGVRLISKPDGDDLATVYTRGSGLRASTHHHRPMFQLYDGGVTSAFLCSHESCPDCDDWSRTASCTLHPELSLEEHRERERWRSVGSPMHGPLSEDESWSDLFPTRPRRTTRALDSSLYDLEASRLASFLYGVEVSNSGPMWRISVG